MSRNDTLFEILDGCPKNDIIVNNMIRAYKIINSSEYQKIICTISGGADSDVVLDICHKCDMNQKIVYCWIDTGLEYQATKEHLKFLEQRYEIEIKKVKPIKSIPATCGKYGIPFLSKNVSEMISRLQKHNFSWENDSYENLLKKYCKWNYSKDKWIGCSNALAWWSNENQSQRFCVNYNKDLKSFLMKYPPEMFDLNISSKCCQYTKKNVVKKLLKDYELNISGIRRAEGGIRSTAYRGCFDETKECDNYRPLFWYRKDTREIYEKHFHIQHSSCYTIYNLTRTGCAGCPFSQDIEHELKVLKDYEPNLHTAATNIFHKSYEYEYLYQKYRSDFKEA